MANYYTHYSTVVPFDDKLAPAAVARLNADATRARADEPAGHDAIFNDDPGGIVIELDGIHHGVWIADEAGEGDVDAAVAAIQWLLDQPGAQAEIVALEWANSCSKPRLDAYGGGAAVVTRDTVHCDTTAQAAGRLFDQMLAEWATDSGFVKTNGTWHGMEVVDLNERWREAMDARRAAAAEDGS